MTEDVTTSGQPDAVADETDRGAAEPRPAEASEARPEQTSEPATSPPDLFAQRLAQLEQLGYYHLQQTVQLAADLNRHGQAWQSEGQAIHTELKRYRTSGPERAMSAIFYRLFGDLVGLMNDLDQLVELGQSDSLTEHERAWGESFGVVHRRLEGLLVEWGCRPLSPQLGGDFDPEHHEAVAGDTAGDTAGDEPPPGTIVRIERRGWTLHDSVLQYPQVVVAGTSAAPT